MTQRINVALTPASNAALDEICAEFYGLPKVKVLNKLITWFSTQPHEIQQEILSGPERRPPVGAVATKEKMRR